MEKKRDRKVALIAHQSNMYGASQCLYTIAKQLTNHEVCVVCPEDGPFVDALRVAAITTVVIRKFPPHYGDHNRTEWITWPIKLWYRLRYFARLVAFLHDYAPDLVLVNTLLNSGAVLAAKLVRLPVILYVHEYRQMLARLNPIRKWLVLRWPDQFIAVSKAVRRLLVNEGVPVTKITVVHNGVPVQQDKQDGTVFELRKRWGAVPDTVVLGVVGRIDPRKNHLALIEALSRLNNTSPPVILIVLGDIVQQADAPYLETIRKRIEELGLTERIVFDGFQRHVMTWLQAFDILVVPSVEESFCLVAAEAMMVAKPVIATSVGGLPEVVLDGQTGILINPNSPTELANAIQQLTVSPELRTSLGRAGKERALEMFTLERYTQQINTVLQPWLD